MVVTEDNAQPGAAGTSDTSAAEHIAAKDLASDPEELAPEAPSHESSPEDVFRQEYHDTGLELSAPDVVRQDDLVPDILVPTLSVAAPEDISRGFDDSAPEQLLPDVAPQDHLVPDIIGTTPAVASLANPSLTGPSASQPRKWLTMDGKLGTWQYDIGSSRARFVEKRAISRFHDSNEETLLKAARFGHDAVASDLLGQKIGTEFVEEERRRTPLLCAAEGSNSIIVQMLLENRVKWDVTDNSKRTALHLASLNGRDEIVHLLLQRTKIDVDQKDEQGNTALHLAARIGNETAIQHLLDRGASVQMKDNKGVTPLHLAVKKGLAAVETLLRIAETPVDERSGNDRTPLMQACDRPSSEESEAIVKLLINNHADPSARDNNGETPLSLAASLGNTRVVEVLVKCQIDINSLNIDGNSALFSPAKFGHDETVKVLLNSGLDSLVVNKDLPLGRTALLESAKYDKVKVTLLILEKWAEIGFEYQELLQSALFEAALYDSSQVARLLIDKGANISKKGASSMTPIEVANLSGSTKVVALLLEKGAQLLSQGPSLGTHMPEAPPEPDSVPLMPVDSNIDMGFGFKSTIISFFFDDHENSTMVRPPIQSILYDHSPEAIKTGLEAAASMDRDSQNFRWLHIPGNNPVWVNNLISRMYKECKPPEKSAYFQKKCKHLFGEEVWSRHQYQVSPTSVAHRRFIRPICQQIPINEKDHDNMMMVLPYFHWETTGGREKMTDVIIEAMKSYIGEFSPSATEKLKGLGQALKDLERARNSDCDEKEESDSETSYFSYTQTSDTESSTSPVSSDGRVRNTRRSRDDNEKPDFHARTDSITRPSARRIVETRNIRKSRGINVKPEDERKSKKRIEKIMDIARTDRPADDKLVLSYMFHETAPMHFRRTLDQYYYYTLPTTEARDKDQVVTRYFEKTWPGDDKLVLMVDQLWLWILDNDTVVTSFPQRWDKAGKPGDNDPDPNNASDIVESIIRHVARTDRRPLENAFDLAELIASKCIGTMFEHPDIANEKLRFSEFFEISIGNVTNEESKMFDEFTELSESLATGDHRPEDLDKLFNISKETKLIKEIKDIRDELHIISTVLADQERVLVDMESIIGRMKESHREASQSYHSLVESVLRHIETVKGLDKQAEKTYLSLNDLLDLKQKQANVSEARSQRQQAQETARQGQTLMLFTVITVFFLDISDYVRNGEGQLGLGYVSEITFPITAVVVAVSLFLAFRLNPVTVAKVTLKSTWHILKKIAEYLRTIGGYLLVIAAFPFIIVFVCAAGSKSRARDGEIRVSSLKKEEGVARDLLKELLLRKDVTHGIHEEYHLLLLRDVVGTSQIAMTRSLLLKSIRRFGAEGPDERLTDVQAHRRAFSPECGLPSLDHPEQR
ncbi:hypothetical protein IFR05_011621 [Cadophora sp. M221]|nr:hypothetical protein IFR05_011621 [Cadophora sp. M221]